MLFLSCAAPLLLSASAIAGSEVQPLDRALKEARDEQAAATAEAERLEQIAEKYGNEAQRLEAEQAAAAQAIEAAEASITASEAQFRLASAYVAEHRQRLEREQGPVSSLLAGLALAAQRPPLLALVDSQGSDEFVRISVLLDATLPVIHDRTRALSGELAEGKRLEVAAAAARSELVHGRQLLVAKRQQFAELQRRAIERSLVSGGQALSAGDVALARGEQIEALTNAARETRSARDLALLLASEPPAPSRPLAPAGPPASPPFSYIVPVSAPVVAGLGSVNESGVRSRGIRFETPRGASVRAPADGIVRFSGPFGDYDGIVIIEHPGGWMSLIVNASSQLKAGEKVRLGEPLGRALGATSVELSHNGQRFSPALIAGSSESLSKRMKGG
jgi:septal ring factor EnvC (AmiA/AmiB activator)